MKIWTSLSSGRKRFLNLLVLNLLIVPLTVVVQPNSRLLADDEVNPHPQAKQFPPLNEQEFQRIHTELKPNPREPWRTIPWKISLLEAQKAAVATKQPLFIWAMDGHPLGCT